MVQYERCLQSAFQTRMLYEEIWLAERRYCRPSTRNSCANHKAQEPSHGIPTCVESMTIRRCHSFDFMGHIGSLYHSRVETNTVKSMVVDDARYISVIFQLMDSANVEFRTTHRLGNSRHFMTLCTRTPAQTQ